MTTYGFTGARSWTRPDDIISVLKNIGGNEHTFRTGGAWGADLIIGEWLFDNFPEAKHVVLLGTKKDQGSQWWIRKDGTIIVVKPRDLSSYRDRNLAIVQQSDVLYAFPAYEEDHSQSLRSGTWQTLRMARRKGIPIHIYVEDGNNWEENVS